jgi:hypothetical protein
MKRCRMCRQESEEDTCPACKQKARELVAGLGLKSNDRPPFEPNDYEFTRLMKAEGKW